MNDKLNYTEEYYMEKYGVNGIFFQFTPDPIEGVTFEKIAQVLNDTYIEYFVVRRNEEKNRYDGILIKEGDFHLYIDAGDRIKWITGEIAVLSEDPKLIGYMANRNVSGSVWVRDIDEETQSVIFCTRALYWDDERVEYR